MCNSNWLPSLCFLLMTQLHESLWCVMTQWYINSWLCSPTCYDSPNKLSLTSEFNDSLILIKVLKLHPPSRLIKHQTKTDYSKRRLWVNWDHYYGHYDSMLCFQIRLIYCVSCEWCKPEPSYSVWRYCSRVNSSLYLYICFYCSVIFDDDCYLQQHILLNMLDSSLSCGYYIADAYSPLSRPYVNFNLISLNLIFMFWVY